MLGSGRLYLFVWASLLTTGMSSFAQNQPNILWIITDDQRADALSCYNQATLGQSNSALGFVESANIDHQGELARKGFGE